MAAKDYVDKIISGKKVVVFSKSSCPYCTMAKQVFSSLIQEGHLSTEDYKVEEIANQSNCDEIQDYLNKLTGARTVPRVFINGKCIGGGSETQAMYKNGQLVQRLTS